MLDTTYRVDELDSTNKHWAIPWWKKCVSDQSLVSQSKSEYGYVYWNFDFNVPFGLMQA